MLLAALAALVEGGGGEWSPSVPESPASETPPGRQRLSDAQATRRMRPIPRAAAHAPEPPLVATLPAAGVSGLARARVPARAGCALSGIGVHT